MSIDKSEHLAAVHRPDIWLSRHVESTGVIQEDMGSYDCRSMELPVLRCGDVLRQFRMR